MLRTWGDKKSKRDHEISIWIEKCNLKWDEAHSIRVCMTVSVHEEERQITQSENIQLTVVQTKSIKVLLTVTLCSPVRFGHSHNSWLSDRVRTQGVSPISTV